MIPDRLRLAFEGQARACPRLGSPFMGQLMRLFAEREWPDGALRDRAFNWPGDVSAMAASVPLRFAGALHALKLEGHTGLGAVYPPKAVDDDTLWAAVVEALVTEAAFIDRFIDSAPQTNEVRRAAVLVATGHWLTARYQMPIQVRELGASAGLNLMWDKFALEVHDVTFGPRSPALTLRPDWTGPLPPQTPPTIAGRRGVDLSPLDPTKDALRLRAYLWPDQPERLALTEAAIAWHDVEVDQADAIDWLAEQLKPYPGQLRLIYHTIAWQYFPADAQARGTALIEAAGAEATVRSPLAWFSMEADDVDDGAAMTLRLWPGDMTLSLGRVDYHGRWVKWAANT